MVVWPALIPCIVWPCSRCCAVSCRATIAAMSRGVSPMEPMAPLAHSPFDHRGPSHRMPAAAGPGPHSEPGAAGQAPPGVNLHCIVARAVAGTPTVRGCRPTRRPTAERWPNEGRPVCESCSQLLAACEGCQSRDGMPACGWAACFVCMRRMPCLGGPSRGPACVLWAIGERKLLRHDYATRAHASRLRPPDRRPLERALGGPKQRLRLFESIHAA